jgi:hypothetical protein
VDKSPRFTDRWIEVEYQKEQVALQAREGTLQEGAIENTIKG